MQVIDEKFARAPLLTQARPTATLASRLRALRETGVTVMVEREMSVVFRPYQISDYDAVAALWTRINRELAPAGMAELFEQYIATTIDGELKHLSDVFSPSKQNAFWVVANGNSIVGSFGIESRSEGETELRRMYLDRGYRGLGLARRMLDHAEDHARALGFAKMLVSTAAIQKAADRFYRKSGFQQVRVEVAEAMTTKQAGGGLTRFYFEKKL